MNPTPLITCPRCDAKWTGLKIEHCPTAGCHLTFSSTRVGDAHLVDMDPDTGLSRHLTADELAGLLRKDGQHKGTPRYQVTINPHGTPIWSEHNPEGHWAQRRRQADESTDTGAGDAP